MNAQQWSNKNCVSAPFHKHSSNSTFLYIKISTTTHQRHEHTCTCNFIISARMCEKARVRTHTRTHTLFTQPCVLLDVHVHLQLILPKSGLMSSDAGFCLYLTKWPHCTIQCTF